MANLKLKHLLFISFLTIMRQSISKLMAGAGFSALILGTAQAASAITLTYTASKATYVPVPNVTVNTRPLQLPATGAAINTTRNFIYQDLIGDYAPAGAWVPVSQLGPGSTGPLRSGEQRFDYSAGAATSVNPGPPQNNIWNDNLNLTFGSFYLDGTCEFCGEANAVSVISASPTGVAQFLGEAPDQTAGNQNKLNSSLYNIVFGSSGKTGTLRFEAYTDITNGVPPALRSENSGGRIIINLDDPIAPAPSPLPILGAGAAFGYSRRLRRRIQNKSV